MDEKNNPVDKNEELKHYGVMGMRWGIRNADTIARYGRRNPRTENAKQIAKEAFNKGAAAAGKTMTAIGKKSSAVAKNAGKKVSKIREERKLEKEQAKSVDMSRKEFRKTAEAEAILRRDALNSNNAATVEKGMHLLTDKELKDKYTRLVTEENIRKLKPAKKETAKEQVKEILIKSAKENIATPLANKATKEIYDKIAKSMGVDPETAETAAEAIETAVDRMSRSNWTAEGKNRVSGDLYETKTSGPTESYGTTSYSQIGNSDYRNKYSQKNWTYHSGIEE